MPFTGVPYLHQPSILSVNNSIGPRVACHTSFIPVSLYTSTSLTSVRPPSIHLSIWPHFLCPKSLSILFQHSHIPTCPIFPHTKFPTLPSFHSPFFHTPIFPHLQVPILPSTQPSTFPKPNHSTVLVPSSPKSTSPHFFSLPAITHSRTPSLSSHPPPCLATLFRIPLTLLNLHPSHCRQVYR